MTPTDWFPCVEESIGESISAVLQRPCPHPARFRLLESAVDHGIVFTDAAEDREDAVEVEHLIPLAILCDDYMFGTTNWKENGTCRSSELFDMVQALVAHCCSAPGCVVSLMLGLNKLESCVRTNNAVSDRRRLLKTMLGDLKGDRAKVLQCLLLPTGLNLRNLLWHGFVGASFPIGVIRPWVALVMVLLLSFDTHSSASATATTHPPDDRTTTHSQHRHALLRNSPHPSRRCCQKLEEVGSEGKKVAAALDRESATTICQTLFHENFRPLWEYSLTFQRESPMVAAVVWTALLEHALRLLWCETNGRPDDLLARNGHFYVTLDGHGQRDKHDILLLPHLSPNDTKSALYASLGPNILAFLTDIFISGAGGPNVRAALAHGLYDDDIENELQGRKGNGDTSVVRNTLLLILDQLSKVRRGMSPSPLLQSYRPLFSYTATTLDSIDDLLGELETLSHMLGAVKRHAPLPGIPLASLIQRKDNLWTCLSKSNNQQWTLDDVYCEMDINMTLGTKTATRTLLLDIVQATREFVMVLQAKVASTKTSAKQLQRIGANAHYVFIVYSFCTHVALLDLESNERDMVKIVSRTRMVVSTVTTFIISNADRAYKAVDTYAKSKLAKSITCNLPSE